MFLSDAETHRLRAALNDALRILNTKEPDVVVTWLQEHLVPAP